MVELNNQLFLRPSSSSPIGPVSMVLRMNLSCITISSCLSLALVLHASASSSSFLRLSCMTWALLTFMNCSQVLSSTSSMKNIRPLFYSLDKKMRTSMLAAFCISALRLDPSTGGAQIRSWRMYEGLDASQGLWPSVYTLTKMFHPRNLTFEQCFRCSFFAEI